MERFHFIALRMVRVTWLCPTTSSNTTAGISAREPDTPSRGILAHGAHAKASAGYHRRMTAGLLALALLAAPPKSVLCFEKLSAVADSRVFLDAVIYSDGSLRHRRMTGKPPRGEHSRLATGPHRRTGEVRRLRKLTRDLQGRDPPESLREREERHLELAVRGTGRGHLVTGRLHRELPRDQIRRARRRAHADAWRMSTPILTPPRATATPRTKPR